MSDAKSEMKKTNREYFGNTVITYEVGPPPKGMCEQSTPNSELPRPSEVTKQALRYNNGKLKWHNFPMFLIEPLARVADYGSRKYETFNFLKGAPINQYMDSLKRHLTSFEDPSQSDIDPESQESHLASVAWNALVALYVLKTKPEFDDRYKSDNSGLSDITNKNLKSMFDEMNEEELQKMFNELSKRMP